MSNVDIKDLEKKALEAAIGEMGRPASSTLVFIAAISLSIIAVTWAALAGLLRYGVFLVIASYLYFAAYTPLHESVHRNVSGGRPTLAWMDDLTGWLAGTVTGISYTMHRTEHLAHHQATNDSERDPDRVFGKGLLGLIAGTLWIAPAQYRWYFGRWASLKPKQRRRFVFETVAILGLRVLPALAGFGQEVLWYFVLPNVLGIVITAVFFAWIVHHPHEDTSRWGSTSTFHVTGAARWPVTALWLWQNYHSIHHLYPRVPFYRYHAVFDQIESTMMTLGSPIHRLNGKAPNAQYEGV
ncbi:fatty acid desaturase family protein [Congregibacter sp.]|uniref:fatty acid desaturase family protein n=1 Tax=Congregibacter sp. TaxID=2744308 RepID=UPI003F6D50D4